MNFIIHFRWVELWGTDQFEFFFPVETGVKPYDHLLFHINLQIPKKLLLKARRKDLQLFKTRIKVIWNIKNELWRHKRPYPFGKRWTSKHSTRDKLTKVWGENQVHDVVHSVLLCPFNLRQFPLFHKLFSLKTPVKIGNLGSIT